MVGFKKLITMSVIKTKGTKMKTSLIILATILTLVSCGKKKSNQPDSIFTPPVAMPDASIFSKWETLDNQPLHGVPSFDFSPARLGTQISHGLCNGSYGNSGLVNGVDKGMVLFTGTEQDGIIQVGHTAYVGAANTLCRQLSKESYEYSIRGNIMRLCMVNYPFCADYILKK